MYTTMIPDFRPLVKYSYNNNGSVTLGYSLYSS